MYALTIGTFLQSFVESTPVQYFGGILTGTFEIALLAALIYSVLLFLRGTRGAPVLAGFTIVALLLGFVSRYLGLDVMEWLLMKMWAILSISVLVIFQPEIRRALAEVGSRQGLLRNADRRERQLIDILLDTAFYLAERRIGALVCVEQEIGTRTLAETGTVIGAPVSRELLATIFFPNTPLHDGGVIIRRGTVVAAGCIFPLTQNPEWSRSLGTRHRAGVGVTEETDAVAIIVSEETGAVSLAYRGRLVREADRPRLERHLVNCLIKRHSSDRAKSAFDATITRLREDLGGVAPNQSGEAESP